MKKSTAAPSAKSTKRKSLLFGVGLLSLLILAGQAVFYFMSDDFTTPHYEAKIFATTATEHRSEDLHKLNEAAHYFGQTMIGWTKFPNFIKNMRTYAGLPATADLNAHIQERQNIIFTVYTPSPINQDSLTKVQEYIQTKIDEYNAVSQTKFTLSNLDYEQLQVQKTYGFGAMLALFASVVIGVCLLFVKREFF